MTTQPYNLDPNTGLPVQPLTSPSGQRKKPWYRKVWVLPTAMFVVGLLIGGAEAETAAEPAPTVTLRSAQSYLDLSGFSKSGLADQLEYEEFASQDTEWALDRVDADWKSEAAESAESYLDLTSFSRGELADQLEYEGYTSKQIEHALRAVGY